MLLVPTYAQKHITTTFLHCNTLFTIFFACSTNTAFRNHRTYQYNSNSNYVIYQTSRSELNHCTLTTTKTNSERSVNRFVKKLRTKSLFHQGFFQMRPLSRVAGCRSLCNGYIAFNTSHADSTFKVMLNEIKDSFLHHIRYLKVQKSNSKTNSLT